MPNYIKALILVFIATSVVMVFAREPFTSHFSRQEFRSYRNAWWFLTACLFVAPGIWIFYAIVLLFLLTRRYAADIDRVSLYIFLLFAAPSIEVNIPGFGLVDRLIAIDLTRILSLVVLLPLFKKSLAGGLSRNPSDKWLLLYMLLCAFLYFRGDSTTHAVRQSVLLVIDVVIPYFVISRSIRSLQDFNRALLAMMFTFSLLAAEAIMESLRHWELYNFTGHRLIGERIHRFSDTRAGILRARSIFLSPIILGWVMVFLFALLLYLKPYFKKKMALRCLTFLAGGALLVSFSRATWVGAFVLFMIYWLLSSGLARATWYIASGTIMGYFFLTATSFGQKVLELIPFFGGKERADTLDYRAQLLENGIQVVKRNPLFGDHNYLLSPEMQAMRQGQGIIDTVNGFLSIAMLRGLVGLFFFVMIFLSSMIVIYRASKTLPESESRFADLGKVLLSFMAASMLIISTVSNADYVPILYYLTAALMAAWVGIYREHAVTANSRTLKPTKADLPARRLSTSKRGVL